MSTADEALYAAWAAGDNKRGGVLVERYLDPMRRFFASKVVGELDADDLAAQVFTRCAAQLGRFRAEASFRSYLFGIAYNVLREALRERRPDAPFDPEASALRDLGPSPASLVSLHRHRRTLLVALRALPLSYQVALELAYFEGLSRTEIAATLGEPVGTIASRLRRGRQELRARIEELESDLTARAAALAGFGDGPEA